MFDNQFDDTFDTCHYRPQTKRNEEQYWKAVFPLLMLTKMLIIMTRRPTLKAYLITFLQPTLYTAVAAFLT